MSRPPPLEYDEPDPSEAAGLRLKCQDLIVMLPARALEEAERVLFDMVEFYRMPRPTPRPATTPRPIRAVLGEMFVRPELTISEDGYADP